jgi:hypothetical protein
VTAQTVRYRKSWDPKYSDWECDEIERPVAARLIELTKQKRLFWSRRMDKCILSFYAECYSTPIFDLFKRSDGKFEIRAIYETRMELFMRPQDALAELWSLVENQVSDKEKQLASASAEDWALILLEDDGE